MRIYLVALLAALSACVGPHWDVTAQRSCRYALDDLSTVIQARNRALLALADGRATSDSTIVPDSKATELLGGTYDGADILPIGDYASALAVKRDLIIEQCVGKHP